MCQQVALLRHCIELLTTGHVKFINTRNTLKLTNDSMSVLFFILKLHVMFHYCIKKLN